MPFTYKAEIVDDQSKYPPFGIQLDISAGTVQPLPPDQRHHRPPMRWLDTPESWDWMVDCWTRVYQSADTVPRPRVLSILVRPVPGVLGGVRRCNPDGLSMRSRAAACAAQRDYDTARQRVTVICTTPTYALHLAEVAAEEKIDLPKARCARSSWLVSRAAAFRQHAPISKNSGRAPESWIIMG